MARLRITKTIHLGLLLAVVIGGVSPAAAKPRRSALPALKFEVPLAPFILPATRPTEVAIRPPGRLGVSGGFTCRQSGFRSSALCGGVYFGSDSERESRLVDPVAALGAAYRKCRAITADVLETRVAVEQYPEGYFGDAVSEGMLRVERREFADEARLRELFALLVEAIGGRDDLFEFWPDGPVGGTSLRDIRWETGFVPDQAFEFAGELPVRVEVSFAQQRVLVRAGDKWDIYALDRPGAVALREFLAAGAY